MTSSHLVNVWCLGFETNFNLCDYKILILVTWWTPGPIGRSGPGTIVAATTISCDQYKHRSPVTIFLVSEQLLKTIENFRKDRLWKAKYYAVISSSLYVLSNQQSLKLTINQHSRKVTIVVNYYFSRAWVEQMKHLERKSYDNCWIQKSSHQVYLYCSYTPTT